MVVDIVALGADKPHKPLAYEVAACGRHGPLTKAGELAPLLAKMMAIDPGARPSIDAVCTALTI